MAIARALALDPPLVLADEPTAHLDYVQVEGVLRLIRGLTDGGRVVIVSTHDDRMLPLADQIIEMRPDSVPADRPPRPQRSTLAAGDTLFRQGDPSDLIYVVETGQIDVVREHARRRAAAGHARPGRALRRDGPAVRPAPLGVGPGPRTPRSPATPPRRSASSSAPSTSRRSSAAR